MAIARIPKAIATLIVRLVEAGKQLMQVPTIYISN
jgi:hypothetical protein